MASAWLESDGGASAKLQRHVPANEQDGSVIRRVISARRLAAGRVTM